MIYIYKTTFVTLYLTIPYISQQNGCTERKHKHILDIVRTLFTFTSIPKQLWGEAALTAVYTINRILSQTIHNKIHFEILYGKSLFTLYSIF